MSGNNKENTENNKEKIKVGGRNCWVKTQPTDSIYIYIFIVIHAKRINLKCKNWNITSNLCVNLVSFNFCKNFFKFFVKKLTAFLKIFPNLRIFGRTKFSKQKLKLTQG